LPFKTLETRRLGRTEMRPKAVGLGCAHFGGDLSTDPDAVDAIRRAIELGIDYVDTSPLYGESERRVGLALEGGWREKVYLQTKMGTHAQRWHDYTAAGTRWCVENSLRLLKTDYLDAVLIHDPPAIEIPLEPGYALDELCRMKEAGIVRHVGLGVRQHDFHQKAIETGRVEIVLSYMDYTLLSRTVAETTLPLAKKHDSVSYWPARWRVDSWPDRSLPIRRRTRCGSGVGKMASNSRILRFNMCLPHPSTALPCRDLATAAKLKK